MVAMLGRAADHPEVVVARQRADCSAELHRAAALLELRLAGFDDELACAVHDRDGNLTATNPYPDVATVLRRLQAHGVRIGIVATFTIPCGRSSSITIWRS